MTNIDLYETDAPLNYVSTVWGCLNILIAKHQELVVSGQLLHDALSLAMASHNTLPKAWTVSMI